MASGGGRAVFPDIAHRQVPGDTLAAPHGRAQRSQPRRVVGVKVRFANRHLAGTRRPICEALRSRRSRRSETFDLTIESRIVTKSRAGLQRRPQLAGQQKNALLARRRTRQQRRCRSLRHRQFRPAQTDKCTVKKVKEKGQKRRSRSASWSRRRRRNTTSSPGARARVGATPHLTVHAFVAAVATRESVPATARTNHCSRRRSRRL